MFVKKSSSKPKMIVRLRPGFEVIDKEESEISPKSGVHCNQHLWSFELVFPSGSKKELFFVDYFEKRLWIKAINSILAYDAFDD